MGTPIPAKKFACTDKVDLESVPMLLRLRRGEGFIAELPRLRRNVQTAATLRRYWKI
jgi:hypothetical protein